ncbi:MAG: hypothetical protein RL161_1255 [Bacteroidota bacterium]|jgi:hypothetical protein
MDSKDKAIRFRTEIGEPSEYLGLSHSARFFTIGSCFSETIGERLRACKFQAAVNPFGTIYDPISIHRLLSYAIENQIPDRTSFVQRDGIFFCDEFHSSIYAPSTDLLEEKLKGIIQSAHEELKQVNVLVITYGTAWSYVRKDSGKQVANCHKLSSGIFEKRLLTLSEISDSFKNFSDRFSMIRPDALVMLTVSPVRHIKDTLTGNSVSKAILRVAAHALTNQSNVHYYPAFEILMDDLRDYRFYDGDLIHPNTQAVEYIWQHFSKMAFSEKTLQLIDQWEKIRIALAHRPFHPTSEAHKKFLIQLQSDLLQISKRLQLQDELNELSHRITQLKS